ncbi:hypothetical protein [Bacillus thuringiensis]|uniref:hypothetical protein n=1 Tax=Bacillus thuringiensis TaxID=1428 RepID=UPI00358DABDB
MDTKIGEHYKYASSSSIGERGSVAKVFYIKTGEGIGTTCYATVIKIGLGSTSIYIYPPAMFLHNDKELRT